jgi:hypothetical protein
MISRNVYFLHSQSTQGSSQRKYKNKRYQLQHFLRKIGFQLRGIIESVARDLPHPADSLQGCVSRNGEASRLQLAVSFEEGIALVQLPTKGIQHWVGSLVVGREGL